MCTMTYKKMFGSWMNAFKRAGFEFSDPKFKYTEEELLREIKRVASLLGKGRITVTEFSKNSKISKNVFRRLGKWADALERAGLFTDKENYERHGIPRADMLKILKRDLYKCSLCGASPSNNPHVDLEIDHIKPVSKGGTNDISNLWTLCKSCNLAKGTQYDMAVLLEVNKRKIILDNIKREREENFIPNPPKKIRASNLTSHYP